MPGVTRRDRMAEMLLRQWAPMGLSGDAATRAARERYVDELDALLRSGADESAVAERMCEIEARSLGFQDTEPASLLPLVKRLARLYRTATDAPAPRVPEDLGID
jgi:hypothetical protein